MIFIKYIFKENFCQKNLICLILNIDNAISIKVLLLYRNLVANFNSLLCMENKAQRHRFSSPSGRGLG